MNIHLALAGNPNSGKTTLFNRLTGTRQTTGNWPGVTVEKKVGVIRRGSDLFTVVDLPGIYSLSPYSVEEIVTRNYILEDRPDVIVNIIDATNLERNLFLTLQLKKLDRPMIVALNMMDEITECGDRINLEKLEALLGLQVLPISAKQNTGVNELVHAVRDLALSLGHRSETHHHVLTERPFGDRLPAEETHGKGRPASLAYYSEHDHSDDQPATLADLPVGYQQETEQETQAMYQEAARIRTQVLVRRQSPDTLTRSERIDRVLTHRYLALPIFALVMFLIFEITFQENLGGRLTFWLEELFSGPLTDLVHAWLTLAQAPAWIESLLLDGVISGVGGVLTFLPQITLLFLFLSILEDTGYMARAAFMVDRVFQKFGLTGRSFIPMLMGFGCTVPAVMATRTLDSERDRRLTIMITPFMSCGARMPIYAFFASIFFATNKGLVTFSMYALGILVAVLSAILLSKTVLKGDDSAFLIELPPYRVPDIKSLGLHIWDKIRDFIVRAGTLIFAMSIVIWFLQSYTLTFQAAAESADSILGSFGGLIAPIFRPLGFGNWESSVTLLTGLIAKEAVVASLEILLTPEQMTTYFTPLTAYAFMTFTLLYTPCVAALGAIAREMRSWRWTLATVLYQIGVAYLFSLLVLQAGKLLGLGG